MPRSDFVARARVEIDAPVEEVWAALVDPEQIREYMFGAEVSTDWTVGSPITWSGTWEGRSYADKGTILALDPPWRLAYSHFSPLGGDEDIPENHHNVTIDLAQDETGTDVILIQGNNKTAERREHSQANWQRMLNGLKRHVESGGSAA
jgi:uncharacterized protein YndB with AHSA1/START domain